MINRKSIVNSPDDRLRQFNRMPIPSQDTHSIARFTLAMLGRFYIYLCFEEIIFYFSNYEGFGECTDEARRVQYLQ